MLSIGDGEVLVQKTSGSFAVLFPSCRSAPNTHHVQANQRAVMFAGKANLAIVAVHNDRLRHVNRDKARFS